MQYFHYQDNELYADQVRLTDIAQQYGTPCYIYTKKQLVNNWRSFDDAFAGHPHRICYAVKANSNLAILQVFARLQSGFDIVSQGELERVLVAGGDPKKIVFSGVGKKPQEMLRALQVGISCFNIESIEELGRLAMIAAQQNTVAPIALRVNPDIDARTHRYISTGMNENKFGITYEDIFALLEKIRSLPQLKLIGIGSHIGSQLTELAPFVATAEKLLILAEKIAAAGMTLQHINIGGGLGVHYQNETPPSIDEYAATLRKTFQHCPLEIFLEPGRALVANTGILLTTVEYLKHTAHKNFAIVDAAMNDLLRPALYDAWHHITPVILHKDCEKVCYDIVGPVCESADFLGKQRLLALNTGDLLAIHTTGAYGASMSSNYNSRPRAAEVMVDDDQLFLIRERETIQDLFAHEKMLS